MIDACGHLDTAVWGGIMTRAAIKRNLGGVVIDGGVMDVAEIRELNFPTFVAGVVPRGPSKGFGGVIDSSISCGGCSVSPGDLIIGDDDGVVVIPLRRHDEVLKESIIRIRNEEKVNSETESGRFPYETFDFEIDTIT